MLKNLQRKWKVGPTQLLLILCVFAITGTTTAYISRSIVRWLQLEESSFYLRLLVRLIILLFGYQVLILLIAIPFGQFSFFWNYEKKILRRIGLISRNNSDTCIENQPIKKMTRLAIFASGAGSNAARIIEEFKDSDSIKVALIVCNKPGAGVLTIAEHAGIETLLIEKDRFFRGDGYLPELNNHHIDRIILAGFLWKVPVSLIKVFQQKIVNIHPALLPAYGGKGMYGKYVHEAVIAAGESQSGITIHIVDEIYDHGETLFQATCAVMKEDNADSLASRIHELEHRYYPEVIRDWVEKTAI